MPFNSLVQAEKVLKTLEYETENGLMKAALVGFPSVKEAEKTKDLLLKAAENASLKQPVIDGADSSKEIKPCTAIQAVDLEPSLSKSFDALKDADKILICVNAKAGKKADLKSLVKLLHDAGFKIDGSVLVK